MDDRTRKKKKKYKRVSRMIYMKERKKGEITSVKSPVRKKMDSEANLAI